MICIPIHKAYHDCTLYIQTNLTATFHNVLQPRLSPTADIQDSNVHNFLTPVVLAQLIGLLATIVITEVRFHGFDQN